MPLSSLKRPALHAVALLLVAGAAPAQQPAAPGGVTLSLGDALKLAAKASHSVRAAEAGVSRAQGVESQARSQYYPQLTMGAGYQRTIQSQFQEITKKLGSGGSGSGSGGSDTSSNSLANSPISKIFAAPATATVSLNFSQNIFTAGRVEAAAAGADAARTAAEIGLDAARAQLTLDVASAYFDAVAADQLVQIADSTLAQAERTLQQTTISNEVGAAAEFDLIRARVARDNQKPVAIQARGNRTVALLRLRQLLGIPLGQSLTLTTPIRDDANVEAAAPNLAQPIFMPGGTTGFVPDTSVARRSTVRQAEANVTAQESALRAARWERLPSVQVTSSYQRFGYPASGTFLPNSTGLFFPNWTVTAGLSLPLFTGGRLAGDRLVAEANANEAREQLQMVRDGAALDAQTALTQVEQAQSAYAASVGTDAQAAKAYSIAEVRFSEGVSTQVELQQARTQYEQARLNRVLASRDLEVARLRVALLKDLPLNNSNNNRR